MAAEYDQGVLLLAENPSGTLHKISEIYDRIAFAGVGKYNEFEALRVAGIRHADLKGYLYGRPDVAGKSLANAFSQTLGNIFTHEIKPYEVEILVAELGVEGEENRLFKVTYDGTLYDERGFCAIGGQADSLTSTLSERYQPDASLNATIRLVAESFTAAEQREIDGWEAAALDGTRSGRTFRRLTHEEIAAALA